MTSVMGAVTKALMYRFIQPQLWTSLIASAIHPVAVKNASQ
jgi:hypothetical protein